MPAAVTTVPVKKPVLLAKRDSQIDPISGKTLKVKLLGPIAGLIGVTVFLSWSLLK